MEGSRAKLSVLSVHVGSGLREAASPVCGALFGAMGESHCWRWLLGEREEVSLQSRPREPAAGWEQESHPRAAQLLQCVEVGGSEERWERRVVDQQVGVLALPEHA